MKILSFTRASAGAVSLLLGACSVPSSQPGGIATSAVARHRPYPPIAGPHEWQGGKLSFDQDTTAMSQQFAIGLDNPASARNVVMHCFEHAFTPGLYEGGDLRDKVRSCLALDYMFHRDQRTSVEARRATSSPYFSEDSFGARWTAMMPWGGFASADDMFVFARFAWSFIEPKTINYRNLEKVYHRDRG